ncbi:MULTISPECIES: hypothetical protein [Photorhabdus]|uniref:Lipoprotein n=2 Tax=Photorhabdus asymbiotica TaxID=291112 RepID=B6VKL7_PHOAA|nr:hypothetical protein [Photorhabdus asymbiotica]RKS66470.1 hypothetical protein BDD30_0773 [Photorhabdus asymbiotica]CAQ83595.1 conserved hypothetical protein [Photorhabdus asymbiotica]CAR66697.1 Conserved Hypothetical Protein [Photorhabdus asymbiotica subsp. asymbiotica ATCC 43949]
MNLNKKAFLISPFLLAISHVSMACTPDPEIEKIITQNGLAGTKVMSMYRNCTLTVSSLPKEKKVTLTNSKAAKRDDEAKNAMYWYRGMSLDEYITFDGNKYKNLPCVALKDAYCGIAPNYTYAKSYLVIKNPGVVIEFSTIEPGWLYKDFTTRHDCKPKAEDGTVSYGLGGQGTSVNCDAEYKRLGIGNVFNRWLSEKPTKIDPIISYVLLKK